LSWQNQENRASEAFSQKSEQGKFPFKFSLYQLLALVWLLGAVIFLLWQIIGYYIFSTRMKKMSIPVDNPQIRDIFQYQMGKINISKKIDLMFSFQAGSPMLMGFFSPTLFLPQRNYSGEELEFIFCHELIHCQRGDIFYKLLLLMANACHWFNPLIYLMVKRAAKDLELTCDARVISLMEKEKGSNSALQIRKGYSSAIINAVQLEMQAVTGLSTYFYGGKEAMKERISNIFDMRKKKKGYLLLAGLLLLACFSGVLVACEDQVPPKIDQSFLEQLLDGGFLRMEIGHNLPDYKLDKLDNGENHYIWSLWNKQDQSFIHDVQMMELDGNLTFYHYKDYSFQFEPLPQPLTIKEA
ncbi:MAG: M56 family metallopeptidase, partial [Clostridiales bacterium]